MRRILYWLHLYAGLVLGVAVVFVGLTGSAVVYRPELERFFNPAWFAVTPGTATRPLDELVATAVATYPGAAPTFVSIQPPLAAGETAMVMMKRRFGEGSGPWVRAHVDPYSGILVAAFEPDQTFLGMLAQLHVSLLAGEHSWGEQLVGVFGILLLLFCVTGVVLWWPGMRRLHRAFRVRTGHGAAVLYYDLHRVSGIVFLIPLMLVCVTGIALVFPKYTRAPIVEAFGIERPPRAPKTADGATRVAVDEVRAAVERAYPRGRVMSIQLPANRTSPYQVRLLQPGDSKVRYGGGARLVAWIDPASGSILAAHDASTMPVASRLMFGWIFPTHTGDIAGHPGRAVMFAAGLLPLLLFATGVYLWYVKRSRAARARTAVQSAVVR